MSTNSMSILNLTQFIDRAVFAPESINPVSYTAKWPDVEGSWICRECKYFFSGHFVPLHAVSCSKRGESLYTWGDMNMIYVFGPNENCKSAPFKKESIEKVKEIAIRSKL